MVRLLLVLAMLVATAGVCWAKAGSDEDGIPGFQAGADFDAGYNALQRGDYDEAIRLYDKVIAGRENSDFNQAAAFNNRSVARAAIGQLDRAIVDFSNALDIWPDLPQAFDGRGEAYLQLGQYDKATADLGQAIRLKPRLRPSLRRHGYSSLLSTTVRRSDNLL